MTVQIPQKNNEDILKSLRQLNSCITLTSVKDTTAGSPPPSPSDSSSEGSAPDLSALRGISIQGHSKGTEALLSNLLGKKGKEEEEKKGGESQSSWINEWSKRCLSISFSSKPASGAAEDEEEEEEEEEDGDGEREDKAQKRLENGTPSSSSNSASNSRDSYSGNKKSLSGNNSISIRPFSDPSKSVSVSVHKAQSNQAINSSSSKSDKATEEDEEEEEEEEEEEREAEAAGEEEEEEEHDREQPNSNRSKDSEGRDEHQERIEREKSSDYHHSSEEDIPLHDRLLNKQDQSNNIYQKTSSEEPAFSCSFCSQSFVLHSQLISHIPKCNQLGISVSFSSPPKASQSKEPVARKKTINKSLLVREKFNCVQCKLNFSDKKAFEDHHLQHISNSVRVSVERYPHNLLSHHNLEGSEDSDSRGSSSGSAGSLSRNTEDKSLKLTFKISSVGKRGRGQKRKTKVQIVSPQEMSEGIEERADEAEQGGSRRPEDEEGDAREERETSELSREEGDLRTGEIANSSGAPSALQGTNSNPSFGNFGNEQLNFGPVDAASDRPPSTYQPQFESFPGDWFNEYESGSRIAAAMTGATAEGGEHNSERTYNTNNNSNDSAYSSEEPRNSRSSPFTNNNSSEANKELPGSSSNGRDGLFSQAVLGGEPSRGPEETRQGSFEQLCLNDSYGQNQQDTSITQPPLDPNYPHNQPYHNQQAQGSSDLLSELAYLNNNGQQLDPTRVSPLDGDRPFSSHSSNSGTPTSSGHPTPPPTDTSFRALATSPLTSPTSPMTGSGPTPPMQPGISPPVQNSTSPLQQMGQMAQPQLQQQLGSHSQDSLSAPRLTIANNLMPAAGNSAMGPMPGAYGQQAWPPGSNSQQNFPSNYMQSASMTGTMGSALGAGMRPPQVHANLPMGYRPSPPPRIRGRPPLMGHVGRPPMMRGPGRPPGSSALPPLMAAPGGTRGGMMPSLQRLPQYAGPRQPLVVGQKRGANTSAQSPSKSLRREDINVPARQKDNECQIIAVANRTGDGMPVISNVQGGSRDERSSNRGSPAAAPSESTIHLSDSITLSVRSNSGGREAARSEKGGDAGVVANLLASRGITVTPAAGEKEGGGNGGREERRLPTASDLNLSSAISVHPPTSRDRDGFAVPHPPSAKSSNSGGSSSSSTSSPVNNNPVDRPPRPPTVDLTQEISAGGAQATRLQCHQCDRTFPTQALLSDHAKIHQQQTQSRMPFKCHLCTAGFSSQKGQQHHYQQFHQLQLSAGDLAIPVVDFRNPVNVQRMARLGIRSFLPLSNLQNRGAGGVVGIPVLTLENLHNGQMNLQQWGITDVLTLGPPRTMNVPR